MNSFDYNFIRSRINTFSNEVRKLKEEKNKINNFLREVNSFSNSDSNINKCVYLLNQSSAFMSGVIVSGKSLVNEEYVVSLKTNLNSAISSFSSSVELARNAIQKLNVQINSKEYYIRSLEAQLQSINIVKE